MPGLWILREGPGEPWGIGERGSPRQYLRTLLDKGLVQRVARGLYVLMDADLTGEHSTAEACKLVPMA